MSEIDWVNTNKHRLYPFDAVGSVMLANGSYGIYTWRELPRELLADAGFVLGIRAEAQAEAKVWLQEVVHAASYWTITFYFEPSTGVTGTHKFRFIIPADTVEGSTFFIDATPLASDVEDIEYGTAFLVVGDLTSASVKMPEGTYIQFTDSPGPSYVLASLIQSQHQHYVRRIHLANDPTVSFLECGAPPETYPVDITCPDATVMRQDLQGAIKFKFGYNAKIGLVTADNRLVLGCGIGVGEGVPCVMVSRDPSGEVPGAQTCEGLVFMVNGASPNAQGEFLIQAGKGVQISTVDGVIHVIPDPQAFCTDLWESGD